MIPTNKYLETIKELRHPQACVYYEWFKKSKTLHIVIAHQGEARITIKAKCRDDKQYDNYVKEFESAREKGDLAKFLKRVRSKIISIE